MLFHSLEFLVFLPLVVLSYFCTPPSWRWLPLLIASYIFYGAWNSLYLLLIAFSTLVDWFAGLKMQRLVGGSQRRSWLFFSLSSNLALLFFFKYFDFFSSSTGLFNPLGWVLPVGISFYTFQSMSYSIDVFRRQQAAEAHLGRFALYVAFFPQLIAGPIERASNLLPQLHGKASFDIVRLQSGLRLILWGLVKKLVIAQRLAVYVDLVYEQPADYYGWTVWLATLFFALQIYADFSAYVDMARGIARLFGIELSANFRQPYFSRTLKEFWRRWHITLSNWFRDYLYIPLGGGRVGFVRWIGNIILVFALAGLWHGANATFLVWGLLHALFLIIERLLGRNPRTGSCGYLQMVVTFLVVLLSWMLFRANSLADFSILLTHALRFDIVSPVVPGEVGRFEFVLCLMSVLLLLGFDALQSRMDLSRWFAAVPWWLRSTVYSGLLVLLLIWGRFGHAPFIYFQF